MVNMTLSIPDELMKKMRMMNQVKWSAVARSAIEKKVNHQITDEDEEVINWSVRLQRASRRGRFDELKKKGLV